MNVTDITSYSSNGKSLPLSKVCALGLLLSFVAAIVGCSGAAGEQDAADQLKKMSAIVSKTEGRVTSVVLAKTSAQEIDLETALPMLLKFKKLDSLVLNGTNISDEQLKSVAQLRSLGSLQLMDTPITDEGVKAISSLSNLSSLYVSGTKVTSDCLPEIAKLKKLTGLGINNTAISGGFDALESLPELVLLVAGKLTINAEDAEALGRLPALKRLDIREAVIDDAVLKQLRKNVEDVGY